MRRPARGFESGFTLAEIVVTIAIVGTVGVLIAKLFADITSFNRFFNGSLFASDQAQKLLRPMAEEIRSAAPSATGAYAIDTAATTDLAFYSDITGDGRAEFVRYVLSGTNLRKEVTPPSGNPITYNPAQKTTTTVVSDVRNGATPVFSYYDSSHTGAETGAVAPDGGGITAIRLVRITLVIDADPNKLPTPATVSTLVAVRNLKQQL